MDIEGLTLVFLDIALLEDAVERSLSFSWEPGDQQP
jgi:hypothetical protein